MGPLSARAAGLRRLVLRLPPLILLLAAGLPLALSLRALRGAGWYACSPGRLVTAVWMRSLALTLGLRIRARGRAGRGASLQVGNHLSWLDIAVLGALGHPAFVAKADVRHWPLLGRLAALSGTLFLERGSPGAMRGMIDAMQARLAAGQTLVLFPEGTSTGGEAVLPFFPGLFEAALRAQVPVQPFVLSYQTPGRTHSLAPFVGEDTLVAHLFRILRAPCTLAELRWLAPIAPAGHDRRSLARLAWTRVGEALEPGHAGPDPARVGALGEGGTLSAG